MVALVAVVVVVVAVVIVVELVVIAGPSRSLAGSVTGCNKDDESRAAAQPETTFSDAPT